MGGPFLGKLLTGLVLLATQAPWDPHFDPVSVELGTLRSGASQRLTLWLVNPSETPWTVRQIAGSCGCVKVLEVPGQVPGRGRVPVPVEIHTLSAPPGEHLWQVRATLSHGGREVQTAAVLRASVVPEILAQPPSLQVIASGPTQHEIRITDLRGQPLRIIKAESTSPHIHVGEVRPWRDPLGRPTWSVAVAIAAALPPGQHHEQVIVLTDDPVHRELRIPVSIVRRGEQRIQAIPEQVEVVVGAGTAQVQRLVVLRDRQGGPLSIAYVVSSDEAISCRLATGPAGQPAVELTVDPSKLKTESLLSRVVVHLSRPAGETAVIPVRIVRR